MSFTRQFFLKSISSSTLGTHSRSAQAQFLRSRTPSLTSKTSFHTSKMAQRTVESDTLSEITNKEKELTGQAGPVQGGPTAQAQKHVHEPVRDGRVVSDIAKGEESITHHGGPVTGGPAAMAQSMATQTRNEAEPTNTKASQQQTHSGTLDSATISAITDAEKKLTGDEAPVKGGPTAQAQKHANEPINSETLHDITEGEKKVTGGERVKGGPTSTAQSELAKSRQ